MEAPVQTPSSARQQLRVVFDTQIWNYRWNWLSGLILKKCLAGIIWYFSLLGCMTQWYFALHRFGENEGSYCTIASFKNKVVSHSDNLDNEDYVNNNSSNMLPLEVSVSHDGASSQMSGSSSPSSTNSRHSCGSPVSLPFRLNCFYRSYENSQKGWYSGVNYRSSPPKSPPRYRMGWGYYVPVPTVYPHNYMAGQMVKVWIVKSAT